MTLCQKNLNTLKTNGSKMMKKIVKREQIKKNQQLKENTSLIS
jgi:hypothetical protein